MGNFSHHHGHYLIISTLILVLFTTTHGVLSSNLLPFSINSVKFNKCNTSTILSDFQYLLASHSDDFKLKCENVIIPKTISFINEFNGINYLPFHFPKLGEEIEICNTMRNKEQSNERYQCMNLFNSTTFSLNYVEFEEKYLKDTGYDVFQWINYCFYCTEQEIDTPTLYYTSDKQIGFMIKHFPRSASHCGVNELGYPIIVKFEGNSIYSYACYCTKSNMFAVRCFTPKVDIILSDVLLYFKLALVGIINLLALIIIPCTAKVFCKRNTKANILVLLLIGSGCSMLLISVILELVDYFIVANAFTALSILFTSIALLTAVRNKYNTVMYAITHSKSKNRISTLLIGLFFILCLFGTMGTSAYSIIERNNAVIYFILSFCMVSVLLMVVQSIWMYFALKKVSEINIFKTGTGKMLIFSIAITVFLNFSFSITVVRSAPAKEIATSLLTTFSTILIISLWIGISIVEINLMEIFNRIIALFNREDNNISSNSSITINENDYPLLNSVSENTSN